MSNASASFLLRALDRAEALTVAETPAPSPVPYAPDRGTRGALPLPPLSQAEGHLVGVAAQIAQVRAWLHEHPQMLTVLDSGIRQEVRAMEVRTNLASLAMNLIFTLLGVLLGLVVPVAWMALHR
jgi:hypothetical protein